MESQVEIRAEIEEALAQRLEDFFLENEWSAWGILQRERSDPYEVFAYFPDRDSAEAEWLALRSWFPELPAPFSVTTLAASEWQDAYKRFVAPWSDRQLHWIPLWERGHCEAPEGAAVVYLDAGMAFGTGSHETTRLCAGRLIDYHANGTTRERTPAIIDAGCGSGVLAFSAAALGFDRVYGFDVDPDAIEVCHRMSVENPHLKSCEFAVAGIEDGLRGRNADLLLANIQTDVLIPQSDFLIRALRPGGQIALSGILTRELADVQDHYASRFAALRPEENLLTDTRNAGEWSDLLFDLSS